MEDDQRRWHEKLGAYRSHLSPRTQVAHRSTIKLDRFRTDVGGSWIDVQKQESWLCISIDLD
jgi:hypothetical protein